MLRRLATALCLLAAVTVMTVTAGAQEGYPMTGAWYGDYGTGAQKKDVTLVMKWDGSKASGLMNPGPGATPITSVTLDIIPGKAGSRSLNNPDAEAAIPPVFNVKIVVGDLTWKARCSIPSGATGRSSAPTRRAPKKGRLRLSTCRSLVVGRWSLVVSRRSSVVGRRQRLTTND